MNANKYFKDEFWGFFFLMILIFMFSLPFCLEIADDYDGRNLFAEICALPMYYFVFPSIYFNTSFSSPPSIKEYIYVSFIVTNILFNITLSAVIFSQIYIYLIKQFKAKSVNSSAKD
ncbi:hypothetical protein [Chryseobacterium caseinilyticum]|uniref:Uncharacterized protein n=1 Tax=Chryseobacterium caseinilyticum TaxID=2771428 RepID=A0ABR8Z8V3_9FLAO|nr:hypothetical protein [Chryseobacterium caseinilyticum]MBD8081206.1 hypothetical protein [Chryseobacterium caseinilyticum]